MAKHRTREQKLKSKQHRSRILAPAVAIATPQSKLHAPLAQSFLRVDQKYLKADLYRSISVSAILLCILIGISWLVRYNGLMSIQVVFDSITRMMGK